MLNFFLYCRIIFKWKKKYSTLKSKIIVCRQRCTTVTSVHKEIVKLWMWMGNTSQESIIFTPE